MAGRTRTAQTGTWRARSASISHGRSPMRRSRCGTSSSAYVQLAPRLMYLLLVLFLFSFAVSFWTCSALCVAYAANGLLPFETFGDPAFLARTMHVGRTPLWVPPPRVVARDVGAVFQAGRTRGLADRFSVRCLLWALCVARMSAVDNNMRGPGCSYRRCGEGCTAGLETRRAERGRTEEVSEGLWARGSCACALICNPLLFSRALTRLRWPGRHGVALCAGLG
jgi:hypothetical protein